MIKMMTKIDQLVEQHSIIFDSPRHVDRMVLPWVKHIPFAFFLVGSLKPRVIVELGTHSGNSYNSFCQAVASLRLTTQCFAVDTWLGDEHAGRYHDSIYETLKAYHDLHYSNFSTLVRRTFDEAKQLFNDHSIDILHIDGMHTYDAVRHDFENWLPKLSEYAVVIFHDTEVKKQDFGVHKFWIEISSQYPSINFRFGNGLGVLAVGRKVPQNFLNFLQRFDIQTHYHKLFESLGSRIYLENLNKLNTLKKVYAQLYIDSGEGFAEENSIIKLVTLNQVCLFFDLRGHLDVKSLRFDPSNEETEIELTSFKIETLDKTTIQPEITLSNNTYQDGNCYTFTNKDPYLLYEFNQPLNIKSCQIKLTYKSFSSATYKKELNRTNQQLKITHTKLLETVKSLNDSQDQQNEKVQLQELASKKLAAKNDSLIKLQNELDTVKAELMTKQNKLVALQQEMETLATQMQNEKRIIVDKCKQTLKRTKKKLKITQAKSRNKQDSIIAIKNECHELKKKLVKVKKVTDEKDGLIRRIKQYQQKLNIELEQLKTEVKQKDIRIKQQAEELEKERTIIQTKTDTIDLQQSELTILSNWTNQVENEYSLLQTENQQVNLTSKRYLKQVQALENSISFRIGWFLTTPFRGLYNMFSRHSISDTKLWLWLNLLIATLTSPFVVLRHFNIKNIRILFRALRYESPQLIWTNFQNKVRKKTPITITTTTTERRKSIGTQPIINGQLHDNNSKKEEARAIVADAITVDSNEIVTIVTDSSKDNRLNNSDQSTIVFHYDIANISQKVLNIAGWAVAPEGIKQIDMYVGDEKLGQAKHGQARPDVAQYYPDFIDSDHAAFSFSKQLEEDLSKELLAKITSNSGHSCVREIKINLLDQQVSLDRQYETFLENNQISIFDIRRFKEEIRNFKSHPKFSVIIPVYNVNYEYLNKCIDSVYKQCYTNWEICIYDDASTKKQTIKCLKDWENRDPRIKVKYGKQNGHISYASNEAIKLADGEFIVLLDHDDELTCDALFQLTKVLQDNPELDFIYSDEDKLNKNGIRCEPHFKSDMNLPMLLCHNYICHLACIRRTIGEQINWFRKGYEGAQDYDLFLRITEITDKIHHVPRVLYHWRQIEGSTSVNIDDKNYAVQAGRRVLEEYLKRNNIIGTIKNGIYPGIFRLQREIIDPKKVTIIIPFKDQVKMLKTCVNSVLKKTKYPNYEILLVSNNSTEKRTFNYLNKISKQYENIRYMEYNVPFNYSKINNTAIKNTSSEYVLLLNNDTEVINKGWLTAMVEYIQLEDVGAVGAKLLYHDNTIQHAGVIMGLGGLAGHSHKYHNNKEGGYFYRPHITQYLSACTAACLLVKREIFEYVGGLNEENLKIAFNDVDLCMKIRSIDYKIVYTPHAVLYHYESKSRGHEDTPEKQARFQKEVKYFTEHWKDVLSTSDPYYNPNLTLISENFSLNI